MVESKNNHTESLAARMCAWEEDAYQEFSDTFGSRLRVYFIKRGMRAGEAEDLAVTCVSEISLKIDQYEAREQGSFEGWVFTIASNMHSDWLKDNPLTDPLPETLVAPEPVEEDLARKTTIISGVQRAMDQISETDRMIVQLRYMQEPRTFSEIGKLLNIKTDAARKRHSRALKRLGEILGKDGRITGLLRKVTTSGENKKDD